MVNGDSAYVSPGSTLYATEEHVHLERDLVAATAVGGATALPHPVAARFLDGLRASGIELRARREITTLFDIWWAMMW